jgi:rhodanese-related sulfurtransferase/glyoxylase-like metal-dependent hydrolase (beta-lactamase superfamily II)
VYFEQILRSDIGCAAYLVGSTDAGEAAAVDPRIDMVDEILALASREGLRIRYVLETHTHADHVSGHHELAARTGARIGVHEAAGVAYPHLALHDGDELALGEVRLRVLHTPGHRPEHVAFAVIDTARGADPWVVLTGDSLLIGDVARPDLAIAGTEGADALFTSLRERLLPLPDGTLVYPAHVSGSLCGRVTNRMTGTSLGFERRFNPALAEGLLSDRERFVRYMTESLPKRPPNLGRIVALNQAAAPDATPTPAALSPEEVRQRQEAGALVLDVRSPKAFGAGHIPGATLVYLDGSQFQTRVGMVVLPDTSLVLVAENEAAAQRAILALAVVGYTAVAGYLANGMPSWIAAGLPVATLAQVNARELAARREIDARLQVLDVRERDEWEAGHIVGALHIPFAAVAGQLDALDHERPIAVICAGGERSTIAASVLQARGLSDVMNVRGGMGAWHAAGLPTTQEEPANE